MSFEVAIIGIETVHGQEILSKLNDREFPISKIHVACEDKNLIKTISFGDKTLKMVHVDQLSLDSMDVIFLTGTKPIAAKIIAKGANATIIDLTESDGKLMSIPDLGYFPPKGAKIIASPSSSTIQLCGSILPIEKLGKIESITLSTYHSVSEIGRPAMDELFNQVRTIYMNHEPKMQNFPKQIAFNVIPQVSAFEDDHGTTEEQHIITESTSLLDSAPQIAATCVFVPTFVGHAQSVTVQFKDDFAIKDIKTAWRDNDNIQIIDLESEMEYVTPCEIHGEQQVFLSRIRKNTHLENSLSFWSVMDNLQNGCAYNAVRIAEHILDVETPA
ncbi:MAG: aspartate-semialdehyde dehydrogenase [Alphaproteobacteria bacterium]|nr:aspartate-semialdehyde dehydrogenase [Alphaproteobacteria bacterium]